MVMNNKEIKDIIKDRFVPLLRNNGFKGSGLSFRKETNNHYVYALSIQINKYGGSFCVEMGVYIDFIPNSLGEIVQLSKVKPYDCEFRKRLSPNGVESFWWNYGGNTEYANEIDHLIKIFQENGLPYFKQFENFSEPLSSITIDDIEKNAPILKCLGAPLDTRLSLTLARLCQFLNKYNETITFCDWGLKNIGRGTALIPIFEDIKREAINKF